jgi:hypothetical protein
MKKEKPFHLNRNNTEKSIFNTFIQCNIGSFLQSHKEEKERKGIYKEEREKSNYPFAV